MANPALSDKYPEPKPGLEIRKNPKLALFLTLALPGLGHVYLGKYKRAVLIFFLAELFYIWGLQLAGATIYNLSGASSIPGSSSTVWLPFLMPLPEIFNFSATMIGALFYLGQAGIETPAFFEIAALGYCLTATSGIISLFAMVDVWTIAADRGAAFQRDPALSVFLSWCVPGAGHFYIGERFKAGFFFFAVILLFLGGLFFGEGLVVDRERFFYYWAGQFLNGGATIASTLVTAKWKIQEVLPHFDLGMLYTTVGGLLNVIVMLSAFSLARKTKN